MPIQLERLREIAADGRIFGVKFIRRTDGKVRSMSCRTGVKPPPPSPQPRTWEPAQYNLLQVWDMHKKGWRFVPADSVLEVTTRGQRIAL